MSHMRRFVTVADLDTVTAFFVALGLDVEGRTFVEGEFENDGLHWPRRDGLMWLHLASVVVGVDVA
jgi:hypothetical protein